VAAKKKEPLDAEQLLLVKELDQKLAGKYEPQKDGDFKLGDILIEEYWRKWSPDRIMQKRTASNAVRKFKVVHVSDSGIPIIRALNARGNPYGGIRMPHRLEVIAEFGADNAAAVAASGSNAMWHYRAKHETHRFVPDLGQLDAILLEHEFDPTEEVREKNSTWKEIRAHNKTHMVDTWNEASIVAFIQSLKPGDKFWHGFTKYYTVEEISTDPSTGQLSVLCTRASGRKATWTQRKFGHSRIYRAEPRSFNKELRNSDSF
jgi:hypothetical protein